VFDRADTADAVADVFPSLGNTVADRRDEAKACDYDASFRHGRRLGLLRRG
jgi:hypothetical protein